MINNKSNKIKLYNIVSYSLILLTIISLCYCFIPGLDDFYFAGWIKEGISIKNLITDYNVNGRYIGNTLGVLFSYLSLTEFKWFVNLFDVIVISLLFFNSIRIINKINPAYIFSNILFSSLFFTMGIGGGYTDFFRYNCCFMNYVVPMLFIEEVIYLLLNEFIGDMSNTSNKKTNISLFILSFTSCFFVEHITVYLVFVLICINIYFIIKKDIRKPFLYSLLGSIIGIILMFSHSLLFYNSDYEQSEYRNTVFNTSFFESLISNLENYSYYFILIHPFLTLIIAVVAIMMTVYFYKNISKKLLLFTIFNDFIICIGIPISLLNHFGDWNETFLSIFTTPLCKMIVTILVYISFGINIFILLNNKKIKYFILFLYFSNIFISFELALVSPVGSRCFFITYIFICIILTIIISEIYLCNRNFINKLSILFLIILSTCYFVYILNQFYNTKKVYDLTTETIIAGMNDNKTEITIPIPETLLGESQIWGSYYYYNEKDDIEFIKIPYSEFIQENH